MYDSDDPGSVERDMSLPNASELHEPLPPPQAIVPYEEAAVAPAAVARQRTLTPGWRWVLACGWGTVMAGIGVVANTGFILGDPPFWTGNGLAVLPFVNESERRHVGWWIATDHYGRECETCFEELQ